MINKIPDAIEKSDEETKDNYLIACIKNSLDDNLKNMFDFSYQSFLNKDSEREGWYIYRYILKYKLICI